MEARKIKGHTSQRTIKKYTNYLKCALIKINKDKDFNAVQFSRENKLPTNFINYAVNLGYISRSGNKREIKYLSLKDIHLITETDGKLISEYSLSYNYNHMNEDTLPKYIKDKRNEEDNSLKEGIEELRRRRTPKSKIEHSKEWDINQEICKLHNEGIENYKQQTKNKKKLKEFSDEDLLEELRNRGYSGGLSKVTKINL